MINFGNTLTSSAVVIDSSGYKKINVHKDTLYLFLVSVMLFTFYISSQYKILYI